MFDVNIDMSTLRERRACDPPVQLADQIRRQVGRWADHAGLDVASLRVGPPESEPIAAAAAVDTAATGVVLWAWIVRIGRGRVTAPSPELRLQAARLDVLVGTGQARGARDAGLGDGAGHGDGELDGLGALLAADPARFGFTVDPAGAAAEDWLAAGVRARPALRATYEALLPATQPEPGPPVRRFEARVLPQDFVWCRLETSEFPPAALAGIDVRLGDGGPRLGLSEAGLVAIPRAAFPAAPAGAELHVRVGGVRRRAIVVLPPSGSDAVRASLELFVPAAGVLPGPVEV